MSSRTGTAVPGPHRPKFPAQRDGAENVTPVRACFPKNPDELRWAV
jgi:hypothetical protein